MMMAGFSTTSDGWAELDTIRHEFPFAINLYLPTIEGRVYLRKPPSQTYSRTSTTCEMWSRTHAITAAHCLSSEATTGLVFNIFSQSEQAIEVELQYKNCEADFAVVKTTSDDGFPGYPKSIQQPLTGTRYVLLGYHSYNYELTNKLSAFFDHIRCSKHSENMRFVLGSPGTTRGCSGAGAFSTELDLLGIVVAGRIAPMNAYSGKKTLHDHVKEACIELSKPSYNHIVPAETILIELRCFRQFSNFQRQSLPPIGTILQGSSSEQQFTIEEAFEHIKF